MQRIKNKTIRENIGLVIRYHREEKVISQEILAKKVGISRTHLNLIESRARIPSFTLFRTIAKELNKTTTELGLEALAGHITSVLKAKYAVNQIIKSGNKEKQQKLLTFMESLIS